MPPKTVPPRTLLQAEAEAEGFDMMQWFTDHLKSIVFIGSILAVVGLGLILFQSLKAKDRDQHWTDLISASLYASPFGTDEVFQHIEEKASGPVVAHAMLQEALSATREKRFDAALESLNQLDADFADSYLTVLPSPDIRDPLPGVLRRWIESEQAWEKKYGYQEPELNTERVALVETSAGDFWIGFYPELAKEHVDNFITLAKSGGLNGTSVTSVTGSLFEFGGDASKDDDPFNDVPKIEDSTLTPGAGRFKAKQERGTISSIAVDGAESGNRFTIVTGDRAYEIEKRQTAFGRVLNDRFPNRATLDEVKNATTYAKSPSEEIKANPDYLKISDHPVEAIRIERVTIWKGDTVEDGHDFDVSEAKKPVPEEKPAPADDGDSKDDGGANDKESNKGGEANQGGDTTTDEPEGE